MRCDCYIIADPNACSDGSTSRNGTYTVSGTAAAVAAALDGLVFTPAMHEVAPGQAVTTGFALAVTQGGATTTNTATSVVATAVNDPPTFSVAGPATGTGIGSPIALFAGVSVSDPDKGSMDSLAITLKGSSGTPTDANGTLSGTGLTKTGTGAYALAAATPASLTSELQALSFTPAAAGSNAVTTNVALTATQAGASSTFTGINAIIGGNGGLTVSGAAGGDTTVALGNGSDSVTLYGSNDAVLAGNGQDTINGAPGGFTSVNLGNGSDSVTLGGSSDKVAAGNGIDTVSLTAGGSQSVTLGNGNNTVKLSGTNDVVKLGNGNNQVSGTQGMAFITTGVGNDTITLGGSGSTINADAGTNSITGGTGLDTFVLPTAGQGFDSISGFTETNGDVLDLRAALAATNWNHNAATLGNYLKVTNSSGNTMLAIASSGSGAGTGIATLTGAGNLGLADLLSHNSLLTS